MSKRGPCGKVVYPSEGAARRAISALRYRKRERARDGRLHPYVCRVCRGWHVGHGYVQ